MNDATSKLIEIAENLAHQSGKQFNVVKTYLGHVEVVDDDQLLRFHAGYSNSRTLFSTTKLLQGHDDHGQQKYLAATA